MDSILSLRGVGKTYAGGFTALKSVDLDIRRGEIFALLGPNGADKSTLINMVCGIVSFVSNLYSEEDWLIYPMEWLMIGSFIDIIFFSFAIGYRTKKIQENLSLSLLEEANKVIEKQAELENERHRIAADMHDADAVVGIEGPAPQRRHRR